MQVAKRIAGGFDLLGTDSETNTSLVRNKDLVRISWNSCGLVQLVKNEAATAEIGTLLVAQGEFLMPTGDRQSTRTVGRLLAPKEAAAETKTVTLSDGSTRTAYLLPIQVS
jgi:hypothetical protein